MSIPGLKPRNSCPQAKNTIISKNVVHLLCYLGLPTDFEYYVGYSWGVLTFGLGRDVPPQNLKVDPSKYQFFKKK